MPENAYRGSGAEIAKKLPPEVFKYIPFAKPPDGIEPDFRNPTTNVPAILGASIACFFAATFCLSVRVYAKIVILKKWKWEDTLIVLGYILSIVHFSGFLIGSRNGSIGRHEWDIHLDKVLGYAGIMQSYLIITMAVPSLGLLKVAFFLQYFTLFGRIRYVRISVYVFGTLSTMFYLSITITVWVLCNPWPGESLLDMILSDHFIKFAHLPIPVGVIGMTIDCIILFLPLPAIWSLHMPTQKRVGLVLIFTTGSLGTVASIISLYYRTKLQINPTDSTWQLGYVTLWTHVEMWAGVTAFCMPSIKHVFTNCILAARKSLKIMPPARKRNLSSNASFGVWGYRSNIGTASTERIAYVSDDFNMEILAVTDVSMPQTAHAKSEQIDDV